MVLKRGEMFTVDVLSFLTLYFCGCFIFKMMKSEKQFILNVLNTRLFDTFLLLSFLLSPLIPVLPLNLYSLFSPLSLLLIVQSLCLPPSVSPSLSRGPVLTRTRPSHPRTLRSTNRTWDTLRGSAHALRIKCVHSFIQLWIGVRATRRRLTAQNHN